MCYSRGAFPIKKRLFGQFIGVERLSRGQRKEKEEVTTGDVLGAEVLLLDVSHFRREWIWWCYRDINLAIAIASKKSRSFTCYLGKGDAR